MDLERQNRYFGFRLGGVAAAFEERASEQCCLLLTLANARSTSATIVIELRDGSETWLALRPFEKLLVYPPLVVARTAQDVVDAFRSESLGRGSADVAGGSRDKEVGGKADYVIRVPEVSPLLTPV